MVELMVGSLFDSYCQTLVNPVNTRGVMGGGLALAFKKKYPMMFVEYEALCRTGSLYIGALHLYKQSPQWVLNFPTKDDYIMDSVKSYIEIGLKLLVEKYEEWGIKSIAFPALGCGLGGLSFIHDGVLQLLLKYLEPLPIRVELYLPKE
jgi:O-acetyl-ADP-ribose deacetylase (regulator of RNase III)